MTKTFYATLTIMEYRLYHQIGNEFILRWIIKLIKEVHKFPEISEELGPKIRELCKQSYNK